MASYHREIRKWVGILLDKIFLEHAYRPKISDLSLEQAHVLLKFPDGASLTEYTRFYKVKRSEALSLLDSLIRAGYVIKREDPEDLKGENCFSVKRERERRRSFFVIWKRRWNFFSQVFPIMKKWAS